MIRPDDHRGRIGAAEPQKPHWERDHRRKDEYSYNSPKPPLSPLRRESTFRDEHNGRDRFSLKVYHKVTDICAVKDYVIRDGQLYDYDNFYEFVKKLLESVNVALSTKFTRGSYTEKKLSELISPGSADEQKRLSNRSRNQQFVQCHMVVLGLPQSIFVGNGFGVERTNSSVFAAAKDLVEKMHRIGFVSQKLYEVVERDRKFNNTRKLPDFTKAIDCFIALEKNLFDPKGRLNAEWPDDLLKALDQPTHIFDKLSETFKKIVRGVHGLTSAMNMNPHGSDDDIERKIEKQREELLRRERAREMIEPLEDSPIIASPTGLQQITSWNNASTLPFGMTMMPNMGLSPVAPQIPIVPPVGVINPITSKRSNARSVDMDIDKHPYRRGESPRRGNKKSNGDGKNKGREEDRRRNDEDQRLKRKEEELERKMKEEEERRKRDIEEEVRRRLEEELAKRSIPPVNLMYSAPVQPFDIPNYSMLGAPLLKQELGGFSLNPEPFDHELEEIRRLVKETETRLRALTEQDFENGSSSTTLRTLAALGETASAMSTVQRRDLISELRNILSQAPGPSTMILQQPIRNDYWSSAPRTGIQTEDHRNDRHSGNYSRSPRQSRDSNRRRSRSRSPHRSSDRSLSRSHAREQRWEKNSRSERRSRSRDFRNEGTSFSARGKVKQQHCSLCNSYSHSTDSCHSFSSPATRKSKIRQKGRYQARPDKHSGPCDVSSSEY